MEIKFLSIIIIMVLLLSACTSINPNTSSTETTSKEPISSNTIQIKQMPIEELKKSIEQKHKGAEIEILDTANVGDNFVLVNYSIANSTNSYALCNTHTGTIELLPVQDVKLKEVINDNYFIFEDKGEYTDSAFREIPSILHCFRISIDKDGENFMTLLEDESFELDRVIQIGSKDNELLSSIITTFDGFEIMFKPSSDNDVQFYADATDIPTTKTSYDSTKNQITFEFATNKVDTEIEYDVEYKTDNNLFIVSYKLLLENNKTYIVFTLRDAAKRYVVEKKRGPDGKDVDGSFPYISVTLLG